jgi:hypothetical protein
VIAELRRRFRARKYARLTLGPGSPGRHASGEAMFTHPYHDESGNKLGVARIVPRNDGRTLHVDYVGPENVSPGEVANTTGAEGMRSLIPQLKDHYPGAEFLTGIRGGGVNKAAPKRVVVPIRNRAKRYAKVDGHVPAHPLVAGFPIRFKRKEEMSPEMWNAVKDFYPGNW